MGMKGKYSANKLSENKKKLQMLAIILNNLVVVRSSISWNIIPQDIPLSTHETISIACAALCLTASDISPKKKVQNRTPTVEAIGL